MQLAATQLELDLGLPAVEPSPLPEPKLTREFWESWDGARRGCLDLLERLIGFEAMRQLWERWHGKYLYIPQEAKPDHRIAVVCGLENLEVLSRRFGGDYLWIPGLERSITLHMRDRDIIAICGDRATKAQLAKVAEVFRVSPKTVERVYYGIDPHPEQRRLSPHSDL